MSPEPLVLDRSAVAHGIVTAGNALADLLTTLPDRESSRPVPGLTWTVGETAAHVLTVLDRARGDVRRSATPEATADLNRVCLDELTERRLGPLGEAIRSASISVVALLDAWPDDDRLVDFHAGSRVRLLAAYGVLLAELLVHGNDLARSAAVPFVVDHAEAAIALMAVMEVSPAWVDRGAAARSPGHAWLGLPSSAGDLHVTWDEDHYTVTLRQPPRPVVPRPWHDLLALTGRVPGSGSDADRVAGLLLPL